MHLLRFVGLSLFAIGIGFRAHAQENFKAYAKAKQLKKDVAYLASDKLEGREAGTPGEKMAADYVAARFAALGLQAKGDSGYYQAFSFVPHGVMQVHQQGDSARMGMALVKELHAYNVVAFLDNHQATTVIIGAHLDHLGYGSEGSLWTGEKQIHNGADDNASGVASLLCLAEWLKKTGACAHNNYLFIAFSGEEKGLYGSNHFTKNPTIDMSTANYMLNMDMVGRLNAEKALAINGVGTSPLWLDVLPKIEQDGIKQVTSDSGVGPSDHTSFYLSDVPVLHFFTGQHEDYHKPSDDANKINYSGMQSVIVLMEKLITLLDDKGKLPFTKTVDKQASSQDFKVTLGVIPDYLYTGKGLRIDGTKEGRPGERAGLKKGDIILSLGEYEIADIYGYMEALGKFEKGQKCEMKVERDGKPVVLQVVWE